MNLRPYQQEALDALRRSAARGNRRIILQAPTGCGKTHIATAIMQSVTEKCGDGLFLATRRELIHQADERFAAHGLDTGMIMAGEPRNTYARIQVASFDTLHARAIQRDKIELPRASVVIVDEAHLSIAKTRKEILDLYSDAFIIGLTATPARGDGRGLGELYDDLILSWPMRRLIDEGYLVEPRYFGGTTPDLEAVRMNRDGDYAIAELGEAVDRPRLIGDIIDNWERLASDKQTVVFATNCKHSRHLCTAFKSRGYRAEHLEADTPLALRQAILRRVASGETQILCNVYIATYGLDIPSLECAVLARPTKNIALYLQTCGRVLRPSEGKAEALIIDHAGAVQEHGYLDDPIPWSLDGNERIGDRRQREREERNDPKDIVCPACGYIFRGSRDCPSCGAMHCRPEEPIPCHEADLVELTRRKKKENREATLEEKTRFLAELLGYASLHGYRMGWAMHKYRERFGVWPNKIGKPEPAAPSAETNNWIKSRQIAWAKRRSA